MRKISLSDMRMVGATCGSVCKAWLDDEWVGVSEVGADDMLGEIPVVGDVVEAGSEVVEVEL